MLVESKPIPQFSFSTQNTPPKPHFLVSCTSFSHQKSRALSSATEHNAGEQVQMKRENRLVICLIILQEGQFWRVI